MKIRVLLADDHAVMRDGLKALLQVHADIEVVGEVADGREAVRCAAPLKPDIVIMDIAMPGLNGIEATHALRRACPETRVVMLSMYADAEHLHRALEAGAAAYLLKESAGEEVVSAVRAVRMGRRYLSRPLEPYALESSARPGAAAPLARLSAREREVLQLVVEGKSSAEIGALLHLSPKSVDTYRSRLMKKLGVRDVTALVKFAVQHGLTA